MPDGEQDVLRALALEDPDAGVRRAAVARLSDADLLARVARGDADEHVRAEAREAVLGLAQDSTDRGQAMVALEGLSDGRDLAVVSRTAELEEVALEALGRIEDARLVATVARQAGHGAVRAAALARLGGREELVAVASRSEHKDVALAALDRLVERDDLEVVATRARNKIVARRARATLRAREDAERIPQLQAVRRQELCEAVEALAASSDPARAAERLALAEAEWRDLAEGAPADQAARFAATATRVRARLAQSEEDRAEHERRVVVLQAEVAQAAATRLALCERVEVIEGDTAAVGLDEVRTIWVALAPWPEAARDSVQARDVEGRFARACADCENRIARHAENAQRRAQAAELLARLREAVELGDVGAARQAYTPLRQAWQRLTGDWAPEPEAGEEFRALSARLAAREADSRQQRAREALDNVKRIGHLCEHLEGLVAAPDLSLRDAERGVRESRAVIDHPGPLPSRHDQERLVDRLRKSHAGLLPRLHELREAEEWRRWANAGVQEELCARAEALAPVEDLAEVARQVRVLQAEWKKVGAAPRERADELWHRFRVACDAARQRCDGYFKEQRELEAEHARLKEALCAQAEALADSTDWIRTAEELKRLQAEWQRIGPVAQDRNRELWGRFRAACDRFFTRRKQDLAERKHEWADNLRRKEAICARAEELATSPDWTQASAELKRLQAEWKTIGPVKRTKSEALWRRFRAACDTFFERYKNRDQLALAGGVEAREALCIEMEALATARAPDGEVPAEPPDDLASSALALWERWMAAPRLPRPVAEPIEQRFESALGRLLEAHPGRFKGTRLDVDATARRMEQLCAQVEGLVAGRMSGPDLATAPAQALASLLKDALAANTIGGRVDDEAKRRAAVTAVRDAQVAWRRLGLVPGERARVLAARFHRACRRFFEQATPVAAGRRPPPA